MKYLHAGKVNLDRKELNEALSIFKKLLKKKFDTTICIIRVMPEGIELSTPGIMRAIHGETEGLYEFLVPIKILYAYSSSSMNKTMNFVLHEGKMECDKSIYTSPMIKMKNWQQNTIDNVAISYSNTDLLKLGLEKSAQYLEENNLVGDFKTAQNDLELDIHSAMEILSKYELKKQDIRDIIEFRLKKNLGLIK